MPNLGSAQNTHLTSLHQQPAPHGPPDEPKPGLYAGDERVPYTKLRSTPMPYAGRIGGNQGFTLDPSDPNVQHALAQTPDASPLMTLRAQLSLSGLKQVALWKAALIEGVGSMMLYYIIIMLSVSPALNVQAVSAPSGPSGIFGTAAFLGTLTSAIANILFVTLFVYSFGAVSGGHLNFFITIATFFCRLTTLPRLVLYIGCQSASAALAGLLVRSSMDSTLWKAGGCFFDPNLVSVRQMFTVEFSVCLALIFLAFGVGLDPRQAGIFGPALAPLLVGFDVGVCGLASAFAISGYSGASGNPGKCLAVWVGSEGSLGVTAVSAEFGYHEKNGDMLWIYYAAGLAAGACHAGFYLVIPSWSTSGTGSLELRQVKSKEEKGSRSIV